MSRPLSALIAALVCAAAPQAASAYDRLPDPLASLTPADFAQDIQVLDDPLEPMTILSTRDGYTRGRSIEGAHASDVHLRVLVDRASGRTVWQVWHELVTTSGHKHVTAVHYRAGGEPAPLALDHWLDQCPPTDGIGSCNQVTRIGFALPEHAVREMAAAYAAGSREPWRLRFKDASGHDVTGGLAPAEAAGLVQALDTWRRGPVGHATAR